MGRSNLIYKAKALLHSTGEKQKLLIRFAATGLLFLLPLTVLLYDFQGEIGRGLRVARLEQEGVAYSRPLSVLLLDSVQADGTPSSQKAASQAAVAADMDAMNKADRAYGQTLETHEDWSTLQDEWGRLSEPNLSLGQTRERQAHFEQGIKDLLTKTSNTADLVLDPDMDSYYVMDGAFAQLPQIVINSRQMDAVMSLLPTRSALLPPVDQERVITLRGQINTPMVALRYDISQATEATPSLKPALNPPAQNLSAAVQAYVDAIEDNINGRSVPRMLPSPRAVYQASRECDRATLDSMDELLARRIATFCERRARVDLLAGVCAFFALLFFVSLYRVTLQTLRQAQEAERRIAEAASREVDARLRTVISSVPVVVFALNPEGIFTFSDGKGLAALGLIPGEVVGRSAFEMYAGQTEVLGNLRVALTGMDCSWTSEISGRYFQTHSSPVHDENEALIGIVAVSYDLTEHKRLEQQLAHQAFHDSLTGLPNRALFLDRLTHALSRSERQQSLLAVLFVDLDNFKVVNDSLGHAAGDALLLEIAGRLGSCARAGDTVARLGGDEFTLLLEDIPDPEAATDIAGRIASALRLPIVLEGRTFFVTASIGLAMSSPMQADPDAPRTNVEDLLREADVAMYQAKNGGKARWAVFDQDLNAQTQERVELETDLRLVLAGSEQAGELTLHYQPIVALDTGRLAEVEALVRWKHPTRGLLPPLSFITIAEEHGMIADLGHWVLREACRQTHQWQQDHPHDPSLVVSVNLSLRQLEQSDLVAQVAGVLAETGLCPACLKLEITESVMMANAESSVVCLQELKELGVRLAVDDFGTGYSSMSYLGAFPLDTLKIDRAFISRLDQPEGRAIIQAIVTLAHSLGLEITSEGIETESQCLELREMGCERGQGYFFARPQTSEALEASLADLLKRTSLMKTNLVKTSLLEAEATTKNSFLRLTEGSCYSFKAPSRIELLHKGFADLSLTTWARRRDEH